MFGRRTIDTGKSEKTTTPATIPASAVKSIIRNEKFSVTFPMFFKMLRKELANYQNIRKNCLTKE